MPPGPSARLSVTSDRAVGLGLIALGAVAIIESRVLPMGTWRQPGPAAFPVMIALGLIVFGALLTVFARNGTRLGAIGWEEARQALMIAAGAAAAALLLERAGYVITMAGLLFYLLALVARRHWAISLIVAASLAAGTFLLFDTALRVPLPRSPLGFL